MSSIDERDERVVKMTFDNEGFERKTLSTIAVLDKLKSALHFEPSTSKLATIADSVKDVSFEPLAEGITNASHKFSVWESMALGAMIRVGEKAFDTGERLVKSLSTDNFSAGWDKFGNKTSSVATLVAQGYKLKTVNEQLDRLNWYTDETSYNFTDMVANIAKFTASGQKLKPSITAMEGIANWAALSGQNAQTASRAMYQLSQAMGAGVMRKEDYKSIQNASMDTDEFRQKCLDAGVALGTLKKNADGTYKTLVGTGDAFTKNQFADHLTKDAWLTSDVMMSVYNEYAGAVDKIYNYAQKHGVTASEAIEALGDKVDAFGLKAFEAAQKARTWSDVVDSVKDAVSTGWMNTFELIIGDSEQATKLYTDMANSLYDVFAEGGNARNELLQEWNDQGGRDILMESAYEAGAKLVAVLDTVKESFRNVFSEMNAEQLLGYTEALHTFVTNLSLSANNVAAFKNILTGMFTALKIGKKALGEVGEFISPAFEGLGQVVDDILHIGNKMALATILFDTTTDQTGVLTGVLDQVGKKASAAKKFIEDLTSIDLHVPTVTELDAAWDNVKMTVSGVKDTLVDLKNGFVSFFDALDVGGFILDGIVKLLGADNYSRITTMVTNSGNTISAIASGLAEMVNSLDLEQIGKLLQGGMLVGILEAIREYFTELTKTAKEGRDSVKSIGDFVNEIVGWGGEITDGIVSTLRAVEQVLETYQTKLKAETLNEIAKAVLSLTASMIIMSAIDKESVTDGLAALAVMLTELIGSLIAVYTFTNSSYANVWEMLGDTIPKDLRAIATSVMFLAIGVAALSRIPMDQLQNGLVVFTLVIGELVMASAALTKIFENTKLEGGLVNFSVTILLLVGALKMINSIGDMNAVKDSLIALGVVMLELVLTMHAFNAINFGNITFVGSELIKMAASMILVAEAIKIVTALDTEKLPASITALAGLFSLMSMLAAVLGQTKGAGKFGNGMIAMSIGLIAIAGALKMLNDANVDNLVSSMMVLSGVIIALTVASMGLSIVGSNAGGVLVMSVALLAIAGALKILASIPEELIATSLISIAGALVIVAGAAAITSALGPAFLLLTANMLAFAVGTAAVGAGALVLASGLTALGVALVAVVGSVVASVKGLISGFVDVIYTAVYSILDAIGLLIYNLSVGLMKAFVDLGTEFDKIKEISAGKAFLGLLAIAAGLAAIGFAGAVLAKGAPGLLMFGAALFLIGIGVSKASDSIRWLVDSLRSADDDLPKIAENLKTATYTVGNSVVVGFVQGLADNTWALGKAFGDFLVAALWSIGNVTGELVNAAIFMTVAFISALANGIADATPTLVDALGRLGHAIEYLLVSIFQGIVEIIPIIGPQISEMLDGVKDDIRTKLDDGQIHDAGQDASKQLGEGFADGASGLPDAFQNGPMNTIFDVAKNSVSGFNEVGAEGGEQFLQGLTSVGSDGAATEAGSELGNFTIEGLGSVLEQYTEEGDLSGLEYVNGLLDNSDGASSAGSSVASSGASGAGTQYSGFYNSGSYSAQGLINGLLSKKSAAYNAGYDLGKAQKQGTDDALGVSSPAKEMIKTGRFSVEGLAIGLTRYGYIAYDAARTMADNALDKVRGVVAKIGAAINGDMDVRPVITPIVDLSNVEDGVQAVNSMDWFTRSSGYAPDFSYRMAGVNHAGVSQMISARTTNGDVVSAINRLEKGLKNVGGATYTVGNVQYGDNTAVGTAVRELINACLIERRA